MMCFLENTSLSEVLIIECFSKKKREKSVFVFLRQIERKFAAKNFSKKKVVFAFLLQIEVLFFGFCGKWKQLNWIFTRRLCKKKSFRNKILFTKAPSQKPLLLIYQLDSKQHQQVQALLDALRAPWSSASRFLSFIMKQICSQKEEKRIGDFLVLLLKRLLEQLVLSIFRAILGKWLQVTTNFCSLFTVKTSWQTPSAILFFCWWSTLVLWL